MVRFGFFTPHKGTASFGYIQIGLLGRLVCQFLLLLRVCLPEVSYR